MITQEVWMDLRALARQGYNFSQLGELVGLDRRTVKKHLQLAQLPVYRRSPQSSKLDPFRPLIEQWLDDLVQQLRPPSRAMLVSDEVGCLPLHRVEANDLFQLICR